MTAFTAIDLSKLPAPDLVETLDYETLLQEWIDMFLELYTDYDAETLESDPIMKLLEAGAYREMTIRARVNDAAKQTMLAFSTQANLDHLGALLAVERLLLDPGDPDTIPPVDPVYESDEDFRRRIQLAPEALTTAGSQGAYLYHALSVAGVKDASCKMTAPGEVTITVLSRDEDGKADEALVLAVEEKESAEDVRPLTDKVIVQGAEITSYKLTASLSLYDGPDKELVRQEAEAQFWDYATTRHKLGEMITGSGLHASLQVEGVQKVTLDDWQDIECTEFQAPYCTGLTLEVLQ